MFVDVRWCSLMFVDVLWCSLMFVDVRWCSLMFFDVRWCSLMFFDVRWCSLMFFDVRWGFPWSSPDISHFKIISKGPVEITDFFADGASEPPQEFSLHLGKRWCHPYNPVNTSLVDGSRVRHQLETGATNMSQSLAIWSDSSIALVRHGIANGKRMKKGSMYKSNMIWSEHKPFDNNKKWLRIWQ